MSEAKETQFGQANQVLRSDIDQVNQELAVMPEMALDAAIRRGIAQGRKRSIRRSRKRWSMSIIAAGLSVILLLTAFVRVSPAFASIVKDIPGFSSFVDLIQWDKSLLTAIENDFIQPVKLSDEKNGYKFTVDGIIADDQRMAILYTVEGPGINGNTGFLDYKLKTSDGKDLVASIGSSHYPSEDAEGSSVPVHHYLDILMGDGSKMPENLQFSLLLGGHWLKVDFPIEHERFAGMREEISIEQKVEVGGQRFTVKDAVITPLQISVTIEADANNEKHANGFINIALVDEKGRRYESNSAFGDSNTSITRHFKSSYFVQPKKLTLVADGSYLSENGLSVTVDTDKIETLSSPNNRLLLASKELVNGEYEVKFDLLWQDEIDKKPGYTLFAHGGTFKDGAGVSYPISDKRGVQWNSDEDKVTYVFRIPKADYKQPLTFDIEQYPGYVLKPISIPIK
jgi:hypothetical protein